MDKLIGLRVQSLINHYNHSALSFANAIGSTSTTINNIINEKGGMRYDTISKIIETFREINEVWLLTGEGNMLKSDIGKPKMYIEDRIYDLEQQYLELGKLKEYTYFKLMWEKYEQEEQEKLKSSKGNKKSPFEESKKKKTNSDK